MITAAAAVTYKAARLARIGVVGGAVSLIEARDNAEFTLKTRRLLACFKAKFSSNTNRRWG
jgi:hypothetical protein